MVQERVRREAVPGRARGALAAGLLLLHAGLLGFSGWRDSPTMDEPTHLATGIYNWQFGRFDLNSGNPPLVSLVVGLPVLLAEPATDWQSVPHPFPTARRFLEANGPRTIWLVTLGRWAFLGFSLSGGYFCFRWARELYGDAAGITALALWCFSPTVLAYGHTITGDMPATALGIAAFYLFWKWLTRPSLGGAVSAGLFLGLAELAKFVWVLLYGLLPVLWVVWRLLDGGEGVRRSWSREAGHLLLACVVSAYVINLGYAFEQPFQPLGRFEVGRRALAKLGLLASGDLPEPGAWGTWAAALPVPLPEHYVAGIDAILTACDRPQQTYLRRQWREGGFWYYYGYAYLVKTPLGTLGLLAVAGGMILCGNRSLWRTELLLILSAAAIFAFVTASKAPQMHRYALPALPLLIVLAAKAGRLMVSPCRPAAVLAIGLLAWSIVSSLWAYPHSLAYFNEMAGGPLGGHAHLIGSSIDWGQDFSYLRRWQDKNPQARPLGLTWRHGIIEPEALGVEGASTPAGLTADRAYTPADMMPLGPQPGWYAVNVSALHSSSRKYAYFFCFEPVATAGYSIYIYHITLEEANRVRRQLGMPRLAEVERSAFRSEAGPNPRRGADNEGEPRR